MRMMPGGTSNVRYRYLSGDAKAFESPSAKRYAVMTQPEARKLTDMSNVTPAALAPDGRSSAGSSDRAATHVGENVYSASGSQIATVLVRRCHLVLAQDSGR